MKFDTIRLSGGSSVDFPILGADSSSPYLFKTADGLGPPEIVVNIAQTTQEGGVYQGRQAQNRQIVMRAGLQPDWNVGQTSADLRDALYDLLTPKYGRVITPKLLLAGVTIVQTKAMISRLEASIFSADPEVQITLDCFSPYLVAPDPVLQVPTKSVSGGNTTFGVTNVGTAEAGFTLQLIFTAALVDSISISDGSSFGQQMDISATWDIGDILSIDTRPGTRGVWRIPNGSSTPHSILNSLAGGSTWLPLYKGLNTLVVDYNHVDVPTDGFSYLPTYWGV